MSLQNIIGQDAALRMLRGAIQRERVASSYLFTGEEGVGKRLTAIEFVKTLNCTGTRLDESIPDTCGTCSSCRKIESGTHPDFVLIEPESGMIKVEAIRKLEETLSLKSLEASTKAAIVDDADLMNESAANAFLKTLEEPASDTLIILVSSRPDRLPQTIRSRCSLIRFSPLSPENCARIIGKAAEKSPALNRLCMGRPGLAVRENLMKERERFFKALRAMMESGGKPTWGDKQEIERWMDMALLLLRDITVLKATGSQGSLVNMDMADELNEMSARATLKGILDAYEKIRKLRGQLLFNLNKGITWNYTGTILGEAGIHV